MDSRYDPAEAQRIVDRYAAKHGEDLALRVYTSRLLGREPTLVLHGGGNTSVKSRVVDLLGDATEVLFVKGSGADLATVEPRGFPACRLAALRRFLERPAATDEEMAALLLGQRLDAASPAPSIEALLHAFLPGKFVEHTHADAVLAIVDQPGSADLVREVWGDQAVFVPYAMAGVALARRMVEAWKARRPASGKAPPPTIMVLDKHGILTWGDTARDSYERMVEAVTLAEDHLREHAEEPRLTLAAPPSLGVYAQIGPAVRGALTLTSGKPWILSWRTGGSLLAFTERDDLDGVSQLGCATPDHVLRTRARPLVIDAGATAEPAALRGRIEAALRGYADLYHDAFRRFTSARGVTRTPLDPWPRVLLFPGIGVLTVGRTRADAEIVADVYEHTAAVIQTATALGSYRPAEEIDLFDVEHSSLEQAKLHRAPVAEGPLERRIVLVTGAGSSVGAGVCRALCAAGAHVLLVDRGKDALATARQALDAQFPGRAHYVVADVSEAAEARRVVGVAAERFGGLDVVVSCAAAAPSGALHTRAGDQALRASLEGDLLGHQAVARAAAELMLAQGTGGALLFTVSRNAGSPGPDVPEAALVALMRQYARDLAPYGIRANAVGCDRARADARSDGMAERAGARSNPLRRETTVDDVARAFVYLATAEATSGCVLTVDGGNAAAFSR